MEVKLNNMDTSIKCLKKSKSQMSNIKIVSDTFQNTVGYVAKSIVDKKTLSKNILKNTRCYLPGGMQYVEGRSWRNKIKSGLNDRNITFFDPYIKPFVSDGDDISEGEDAKAEMLHWMETGQYDLVTQRMKRFRKYDI